MALSVLQSGDTDNIAGTPKSVPFPSNVTSGSLLIIITGFTGSGVSVSSVTDSVGSTAGWTLARRYYDATANQAVEVWYAVATASGAYTASVAVTGGTPSVSFAMVEVGGWSGTPTENVDGQSGGNGTTHTHAQITTTVAESYVVGAARTGATYDANSPTDSFTQRVEDANIYVIDRILTGTATVQPAFSTVASEVFAMAIVAFAVPVGAAAAAISMHYHLNGVR